jgi:malic enzyme
MPSQCVAPMLGGINLEDIEAPNGFYLEKKLRERTKIAVFHDDQHGPAIIASAAILNVPKVVGKKLDEVNLVVQARARRWLPGSICSSTLG